MEQSPAQLRAEQRRERQRLAREEEAQGIVRPDGGPTRYQTQRRNNAGWETILERVLDNYARPGMKMTAAERINIPKEHQVLDRRGIWIKSDLGDAKDADDYAMLLEELKEYNKSKEGLFAREKFIDEGKSDVAKLEWLRYLLQAQRMAGRAWQGPAADEGEGAGAGAGAGASGSGKRRRCSCS